LKTTEEIKEAFFSKKGQHTPHELRRLLGALVHLGVFKDEWTLSGITTHCDCGRKARQYKNIARAAQDTRCECGWGCSFDMSDKTISIFIESVWTH
jgi:hypothetical protein